MLTKLKSFSDLVVLPHSIFALPFALAAMIISWTRGPLVPAPSPLVSFLLILLAVVSARTAAMAFNRLVDRLIDAKNPRTESREIPAGKITPAAVTALTAVSSAVFLWASWMLGPHCAVLAPFVLAILFLYSFTKRFTHAAHLVLGLALALAPGGAWWVFRPQVELTPILLMAAVVLWVAGFDLLYSTQDLDFDRQNGVFSIPSLVGIDRTLRISKGLHIVAFCGFLILGLTFNAGFTYYCGTIAMGFLFLGQHKQLSPYDLSKVDRSFFTYNGMISLAYLALVALELL
jgi:4-hydroxybenzoate polyprenyltransferase